MGHRMLLSVALCLLVLGTGCAYRYNYTTGLKESDQKVELWRHHLVWGWVNPGEPVDLDQYGQHGVARFGSYESFTNWLCALATLGFYAPETVFIIPAKASEPADPGRSAQ